MSAATRGQWAMASTDHGDWQPASTTAHSAAVSAPQVAAPGFEQEVNVGDLHCTNRNNAAQT
jgi:hypothetical protein